MEKLIIVGTSTTAKTIYRFIVKYKLYDVIGFAVHKKNISSQTFCDLPVYALETLTNDKLLFVAIQWNNLNRVRRNVYEELKDAGFKFANIISPHAIINGELIGDNCWIADLAIIDFGTKIEENVFVKVGAMIGPNTLVKKHSFIGAKTTIGGGSIIGVQSFVGINALLLDEVKIGNKCIIGAGCIIKRSLPCFTLCKCNVDNMNIYKYSEFEIENKLVASKNVRN